MAYLSSITAYVCTGTVLLAACGGDDGSADCGDPSQWSTELIPAQKLNGADHAFAADGALHVVHGWEIPSGTGEEAEFGERRLMWMHRSGGVWTGEFVSSDGHDNVVGHSLAAAGDRLHVTWRHNYSNSSVHYRQLDGDTWSPAVDLTGAIETVPLASASLVGHADKLALIYNTSEGGSIRSDTLRGRLAWIENGALAGDPVTIVEGDLGCFARSAEFDETGTLHVLASCPTGEQEGAVYHLTVGADEVSAAEPIGTYRWEGLQYIPALSLTVARDGSLHALWTTAEGVGDAVVLHARRVNGQWTAPDQVAGASNRAGLMVTSAGDVIVVYLAEEAERWKFLVWADQTGFAPDCDRLPDLESGSYGVSLSVDPESEALVALHEADVADHLALSSLELANP